jgi:hypothetical protein
MQTNEYNLLYHGDRHFVGKSCLVYPFQQQDFWLRTRAYATYTFPPREDTCSDLSSPHILILNVESGDMASIINEMILQQASNPRSAITSESLLFVLANASVAIDRPVGRTLTNDVQRSKGMDWPKGW